MANLGDSQAYSSFSVDEIERVRPFYADVLGLEVTEADGALNLRLGTGAEVFVYTKGEGHVPAEFTVLNFPVEDVPAAVDALAGEGIVFERYDGLDQDERGIAHGFGRDIAWFKDPAGNIFAVHQAQ
jgi:predicted enzyme related to lactoylglutathione lyase